MGNTCQNLPPNQNSFQLRQANLQPNQDLSININPSRNKSQTFQKSQKRYGEQKTNKNYQYPSTNQIKQKNSNSKKFDEFKTLFEQCKAQYKEHYIDSAAKIAYQIRQMSSQVQMTPEVSAFLDKVIQQYQDVISFQKEIERDGWELKSDKNGVKICCRREADGTVGTRIEGFTDVPFEIFISILIQMEFYKEFTPFLEVSKQEKEVARNRRIGYNLTSVPFFTKRQAYIQGLGYSRLNTDKKQLFLFTRSIHDKKNLQEKLNFLVEINDQYIQLDYKYFVLRYKPIKKNLGLVDMAINVDVKMQYVPTFLLEKMSKDFGQKFFKNLVRISKNFKGSKWQKSVENNPHLFLYFQKQVKNYLARNRLN